MTFRFDSHWSIRNIISVSLSLTLNTLTMDSKQVMKIYEYVAAFIKTEADKDDMDFDTLASDWESKKAEFKKMFTSKKKAIKDPKAPKKGRSAYIFYCLDKRPETVEANPDASATDIIKLLGASWKALSEDDKKQYQEQAAEDKERYATESKDYTAPSQDELKEQAAAKKKKDPNAPKRGKSSYLFFCDAKRKEIKAENPDAKGVEVTKLLGAAWQELSDEEKKEYQEQAEEAKGKYLEAKAAYDSKGENKDDADEDEGEETKESPKEKPKAADKPKAVEKSKGGKPKSGKKTKATKETQDDDKPEKVTK